MIAVQNATDLIAPEPYQEDIPISPYDMPEAMQIETLSTLCTQRDACNIPGVTVSGPSSPVILSGCYVAT